MEEVKKLYRFTTIPFLLDLLYSKRLKLLNPNFWEDYNDQATLNAFREQSQCSAVYVLSLTLKDSIHHWNAFASGTSGCCIHFYPDKLFSILNNIEEIRHGKAQYIRKRELPKHTHTLDQLPYVKRGIFATENEYRIVAVSNEPQKSTFDVEIDLNVIRKISFSNKLPETTFKNIESMLVKFDPSLEPIKMRRATTYKNQTWIDHFSNEKNGS